MTNEQLFLETLLDLRQRSEGSNYDHLRACGLLRHLLLDSPSLLASVNRNIKEKVVFHVSDYLSKPPLEPYIDFAILDPVSVKTHFVNLDQFLSIRFLKFDQFEYTVKDIIRAAAHKFGGVHSDENIDEKEKVLKTIDEVIKSLTTWQIDVFYRAINSICTVTLKALEQLESMIKRNVNKDVR